MELIHELLTQHFLQNAIIISIFASILCGIVGTFVVVKKISYISGGIAHSVLGGIGIAYFFNIQPLWGAFAAAIFSAIIIGVVSLKSKQHEDTVISALWAIGMAVGIIFMHKTPGYSTDLVTYLFGNILMVSSSDITIAMVLTAFVVFVIFLFYKQFLFIAFDQQFAWIRGINVTFVYILLLILISITVVVLVRMVGLILVIALLSLPGAISTLFTKKIFNMMIVSIILGIIFTSGGIMLSYQPNLPAGASIILLSGVSYILALVIKKIFIK